MTKLPSKTVNYLQSFESCYQNNFHDSAPKSMALRERMKRGCKNCRGKRMQFFMRSYSDHMWPYMVIYIYMAIYGHIWTYMIIYGHIYDHIAIYGQSITPPKDKDLKLPSASRLLLWLNYLWINMVQLDPHLMAVTRVTELSQMMNMKKWVVDGLRPWRSRTW